MLLNEGNSNAAFIPLAILITVSVVTRIKPEVNLSSAGANELGEDENRCSNHSYSSPDNHLGDSSLILKRPARRCLHRPKSCDVAFGYIN